MKKLLCILFLMICIVSVVYAGGAKEKTVDLQEEYKIEKEYKDGLLSVFFNRIGNSFDDFTTRLVFAVHPFPNILEKFYNINNNEIGLQKEEVDEYNLSDSLTNNNYSGFNNPIREISWKENVYDTPPAQKTSEDPIGEDSSTAPSAQSKRWNIISILFVGFLFLEILYTAVWGYAVGQETFIVRDIAQKIVVCIGLFFLCASLPFLLEAVKLGFYNIAFTFLPFSSDSTITVWHEGDSLFKLSGNFIKATGSLLAKTDPSNIVNNSFPELSDTMESIVKGVLKIVFLLFQIALSFVIIKAGLHIVWNLIEVYFLLTVVMLLMPFAVFNPTKHIGANCVKSLITNVVECFIIVMIVIVICPACLSVYNSTLSNLITYANQRVKQLSISLPAQMPLTYMMSNGGAVYSLLYDNTIKIDLYVEKQNNKSINMYMTQIIPKYDTEEQLNKFSKFLIFTNATEEEVKNTSIFANVIEGLDFLIVPFKNSPYFDQEMTPCGVLETICNNYVIYGNNIESRASNIKVINVIQDILQINQLLINENGNENFYDTFANGNYSVDVWENIILDYFESYFFLHKGFDPIDNRERQYTPLLGGLVVEEVKEGFKGQSMNILIMMFVCSIIGTYLPCFFVQQSTQITNGLLSGQAGHESFANALSSVGGGMRRVAGAAKGAIALGAGAVKGIDKMVGRAKANKSATQDRENSTSQAENLSAIRKNLESRSKGDENL